MNSKMQSSPRKGRAVALAVLTTLGCIACGRPTDPAEAERLSAEGESLLLAYEEAATRDAIARFEAALQIWERNDDPGRSGLAAQRTGDSYRQLGEIKAALQRYTDALGHADASGDTRLESDIRSDLGTIHAWLGNTEESRRECEEALLLAQRANSDRLQASALNCLGELHAYQNDFEGALDFYERAAELQKNTGDERALAETAFFIASTIAELNEFDAAAEAFDTALSLWRVVGDKAGEARTIATRGRLWLLQGEYQAALDDYTDAAELLEPIGDAYWQAVTVMSLARVHFEMGRTDEAVRQLERALSYYETSGMQNPLVDALMALGRVHLSLGQPADAVPRFEQALEIAEQTNDLNYQADALRYLGMSEQSLGNPERALQYFESSLSLHELGVADERLKADTLGDAGRSYEALGNHDSAITNLELALELRTATGDRLGEANGYFDLARVIHDTGDVELAHHYVEQAIGVAESLRTEVASHELRASFLASVHAYYEFHIEILMQLDAVHAGDGFAGEAFQVSEQARARSLLENLTEAGVDLRVGVDQELLETEQGLREALNDAYAQQVEMGRMSVDEPERALLEERVRDLEASYRQAQAEIRGQSPEYAALTRPVPLTIDEVQSEVLGADDLLLEYTLGEERSYVWAVAKDGFATFELPPRTEIEAAAKEVYELLTARLRQPNESTREYQLRVREAGSQYWQQAARFSDALLGPVTGQIGGKRLLVVADGGLQYVPFSALPLPGGAGDPQPLIVDHEIVNVPSASTIAVMRRETENRTIAPRAAAVLADPVYEEDDPRFGSTVEPAPADEVASGQNLRTVLETQEGRIELGRLVQTSREVSAIRAAAGGDVFIATGFDANRETAMRPELANYRIVHFATHAVLNNDEPGLSGLILSTYGADGRPRDGFLRLHDIYRLDLPVELVVLSACNTALGEQIRGEGLEGIVRGFMHAGSKRVVASLWKVDDTATGELMTRFYDRMLTEGLAPAAALRQAQISMWNESAWQAPFNWAAFLLQGEWRESRP